MENVGVWEDNHILATYGGVTDSEDCKDQLVVSLVVQYILSAPVVVFVDMESKDGTGTTTGVQEEYPACNIKKLLILAYMILSKL